MFRVRAHLPNISVLLAIAGLILVIPFLVVGALQVRVTGLGVEAAEQVQTSASRLSTLLRLQPALNDELLANGLASEQYAEFNGFGAAELFAGLGGETLLDDSRRNVDDLLDELDDPQLRNQVRDARDEVDQQDSELVSGLAGYSVLAFEINAEIQQELGRLNSAAGASEDESITEAAGLAAGAAEIQASLVELDGVWAFLEGSRFVAPSAQDVPLLASGVLTYEQRSNLFDSLVPETGPVRDDWDAVRESPELERLLIEYGATAERFTLEGLNANILAEGEELTFQDISNGLELAGRVERVLGDAEVVGEMLKDLVDTTVEELSASAQREVDDANRQRQIMLAAIALTLVVVVITVVLAVSLISRPIRALAEAATRMSTGELEVELAETGPREIRIGAHAINEAAASIRRVESQAIALAEERLDDPVLDHAAPGALGRSLQVAVSRLAGSLAEREEFQEELEYEAGHDSLTKLANRRVLFDHLAQRQRSGRSFALMFFDMDSFKAVNDKHGHHIGDAVLRTLSARIQDAMARDALAARLGGDEFVVVTEDLDSAVEAVGIAQQLLEVVTAPIDDLGDFSIIPEASVGIAMSTGAESPTEILRDADLALYKSKEAGMGGIVVCDDSLRRSVDERRRLREAVESGLANNEFTIHYQPVVSVDDRSPEHIEALIRWNRREVRGVSPAIFIPVAEDSKLIIDLDCWVLNEVASRIAKGQVPDGMRISVNISSRHLSSGRLASNVRAAIDSFGIEPSRLIIEVTETALLLDFETAAADLAELRRLGVQVALDDFGTGYMSLNYLRSLAVDILKIDKSFVDDIDTEEGVSFIRLIVGTAHVLGLVVTAEGVETEAQARTLTDLGVDLMQGYHFAKPGPFGNELLSSTAFAA